MVCLGNGDHSVIFETALKYCISNSFVDYESYSISSKGFLPTVVDVTIEIHDILQEIGIKTIPKKKKCRKSKMAL